MVDGGGEDPTLVRHVASGEGPAYRRDLMRDVIRGNQREDPTLVGHVASGEGPAYR